MSANPFRDEIAIDFPSTGRFVERLRDGLLTDGLRDSHDTLRAHLRVSIEDASRGTLLPLTVVLRGTCGGCGGRGETWAEPCAACRGTGHLPVPCSIRVMVPPGVADGACFTLRVRAPHSAPVRVEVKVAVGNFKV